jgi:hypothetical protein
MLVVENGSEVILHELSHFQRLADKLTFGNINISAPEDIPLGSCQSFLAIEEPYSISQGFFSRGRFLLARPTVLGSAVACRVIRSRVASEDAERTSRSRIVSNLS